MLSESIIGLLRNPETPLWVIKDAVLEEKKDVHTLWVVYGQSGSYSDYRSWSVRAFLSEEDAKEFLSYCTKWAMDAGIHAECRLQPYKDWEEKEAAARTCKHDPYLKDNSWNSNDLSYFIDTVPLAVGG